ncbi:helix-turn-helix transcriptional regulator [Clostridium botulinum]|uniref:helix-turn-helix transcriptional regulator n=1 Tax=Clostridium botulinum TaxID=1491 RepID=UPI001C9B405D|nr:helix-turn-helix transcriptional regulator [Clostridium botulinum]MBY6842693.1 helix-turn-helix transcriptional regulator [Clostridium botulinum]
MNNKGNKIKEQRKNLCYSTRELAHLTNVLEKNIIAYESNKKVPTLKTIEKISKATNTKVGDWIDEEYFIKPKRKKNLETWADKTDEEKAISFFRAIFRADNVMETLYSALIDMKEIKITKDKNIIFSEFAKQLLISISSIKLKKIFVACDINEDTKQDTNHIIVKNSNSNINKEKDPMEQITFNKLLGELRTLFKDTDTMKVMIQALINIDSIDSKGDCSEKAKVLLDTIIANKIKETIV